MAFLGTLPAHSSSVVGSIETRHVSRMLHHRVPQAKRNLNPVTVWIQHPFCNNEGCATLGDDSNNSSDPDARLRILDLYKILRQDLRGGKVGQTSCIFWLLQKKTMGYWNASFSWFFPIHDSSTNAWDQKIRNIEFLPYGPRYHHQGISQHRTPLGSASFWHFFLSKGMLWRQQLALQNLATCICPKRGLIKRFSYFITYADCRLLSNRMHRDQLCLWGCRQGQMIRGSWLSRAEDLRNLENIVCVKATVWEFHKLEVQRLSLLHVPLRPFGRARKHGCAQKHVL